MTLRHLLFRITRIPYAIGTPTPTILILGHMRSGSTLLLHLLMADSRIIGCGERNTAYRTALDLDKLELAARFAARAPLRRLRYTVDQINHDRFTPNLGLLTGERVRRIFLIRRPVVAIRSILDLTRDHYTPWTLEQAIDYYARRLRTLAAMAASDPERAVGIRFEDLVGTPGPTLERLTRFLGLTRPLGEHYPVQPFTGRRGDPSPVIGAGRIIRDAPEPGLEVEPSRLGEAVEAYAACDAAVSRLWAGGAQGHTEARSEAR